MNAFTSPCWANQEGGAFRLCLLDLFFPLLETPRVNRAYDNLGSAAPGNQNRGTRTEQEPNQKPAEEPRRIRGQRGSRGQAARGQAGPPGQNRRGTRPRQPNKGHGLNYTVRMHLGAMFKFVLNSIEVSGPIIVLHCIIFHYVLLFAPNCDVLPAEFEIDMSK